MIATRCPAPRESCHTRAMSGRSAGRPGADALAIVAHTSRCTVGDGGAGRAGFGNHLSSTRGGETACAGAVPTSEIATSAGTDSRRAAREALT